MFGLWQAPGQSAPPRAHAVIGSGSSWSVTAYEGPWGTCFLVGQGESACDPSSRLDATAFAGSTGDESGGTQFGSAAPGVQLLRFKLSNGKSLNIRPVAVGNERLFAFELNNGVLPDSWTAYNSAGRVVARGND